MGYNTLNTRMKHNDKTPAILLLGGDRSQTIGSMSGAFRAYQDLCCIYFDAQFNFRDPHMNGVYGITHRSPHFLLFQKNLRDAIKRWEESDESYRQAPEQQGKRKAIEFFKNQTGGEKYWESLKDNEGYRGFNWLQQQNHKINHRRCAFVGVRDKEAKDVDTGKGLRSPLDTLFLEMLRLDNQLFTRNTVRDPTDHGDMGRRLYRPQGLPLRHATRSPRSLERGMLVLRRRDRRHAEARLLGECGIQPRLVGRIP